MFNPGEDTIIKKTFRERGKILESIKKETFDLIKDIVPIDENLRININNYKGIYHPEEIKKDKEKVDQLKSKFDQNKENEIRLGEALEIVKTYLFNKFKGNRFICVRTSEYDDYVNHVDNLVLDKYTDEIICALDETIDINSRRFDKKKRYILERNLEGGAKIKYFLKFKENKGIISKGETIPIILIATPESFLNKLINLIENNNEKELIKTISSFFEGIKALIEIYIIPDLENEVKNLQKLLKQTKHYLERAKIEQEIKNINSVINKIVFFKDSLIKK